MCAWPWASKCVKGEESGAADDDAAGMDTDDTGDSDSAEDAGDDAGDIEDGNGVFVGMGFGNLRANKRCDDR
jgi:hypothetical protein